MDRERNKEMKTGKDMRKKETNKNKVLKKRR